MYIGPEPQSYRQLRLGCVLGEQNLVWKQTHKKLILPVGKCEKQSRKQEEPNSDQGRRILKNKPRKHGGAESILNSSQ